MKIKKNILIVIISSIILIIATVFKLSSNKQKIEDKAAVGAMKTLIYPVTTVKAKEDTISRSFSVGGILQSAKSIELMSDISGRVVSTGIKDGTYVKQSQILVTVYNEQESIEMQQVNIDRVLAKQTLSKANDDLSKLQDMFVSHASTRQQIEEQQLVVKNAEARLTALYAVKRSNTILAPMSGYINKSYIEVGSYLNPGTVIAELIDNSFLKLQISVLDKDVIKLHVGDQLKVISDLYPDKKITGKISYIAEKADPNRNYIIHILIPNSSSKYKLKAGMGATAFIENDINKIALMIPIQCIVGSIQDPKVYVVKNNIVELRKISTSHVQGDRVVVLDGIDSDDLIIETGQGNISNGATVQIIK